MDTQVADSLPGSLVGGRYRLQGRLSRGGTTTVFTATDERLGRTVAVRIASAASAVPDPLGPQFVDQARTMARLTHPNVVATYDQGTHQGLPYLVLEYVQGRSLREVLAARGRLSPDETLAIAEQVLAGLAAAHRAGIVHGDVRPEHVRVTESPSGGVGNLVDAVAKIGDFGLSQTRDYGAGPDADPRYVAAEVVTGGYPDPRSDVYSAGVVLFEMLTGQPPFHSGPPAQIAWQHVDYPVPPPSRLRPDLPAIVDHLLTRATHRDPGARPSDAGALLAEVQAARQQLVTGAAAPAPADSTMVIAAVPADERPAWARLSAPGTGRWQPTGSRRSGGAGLAGLLRPPADPAAAARQRTVLLAVGAAIGILLLVGGWWFGFGRWMDAPDLTGMPKEEAVAQAESLGLEVAFGEQRHSEHVAEGIVLDQDPAGRVARGGTITLTVSLGSTATALPDVIGVEVEVARSQLENIGLVVREGEPDYSNTVPAGRVVSVTPEVGTEVRPGDEVVLSVSQGRAPIDVPSLIGLHINNATNELARLGLQAEVVEVDSERPGGEVVGQDPAAGGGAETGDTVVLEVSDGPSTVPVPQVEGRRCNVAEQILKQAGFEVRREGSGVVRRQDPSQGTGLPPGSEVHIWCR